jgi:hypothetical protein
VDADDLDDAADEFGLDGMHGDRPFKEANTRFDSWAHYKSPSWWDADFTT